MNQNQKIWVGVLIALVTMLGLMATDIYTPAMPAITLALATSPHWIQLTVTITLISAGLSQLVYGPLSDHWGRRPVLMIGMAIYILGTAWCTFAQSISALLWARFIQGIGIGAIMSLNRIIIRDIFSGLELAKALSYIGAFIALAPGIAPTFGGFIQIHLGWRWVFGFLLIYSLVLTVLTALTLPESHHSRSKTALSFSHVLRNYFMIMHNGPFWANACCAGLALAAMIICATINPFLFENHLGKTPAEYGIWALVGASGFLVGMLFNPRFVEYWGVERTLKTGNLLVLLMSLVLIVSGYFHVLNVAVLIIPTLGIELGIAMVFPNAFIGAIAPFPTIMGAAGALYGSLQIAITFLSSVIVTLLHTSSQLPMGILLLFVAMMSLLATQYTKSDAALDIKAK